MTSTDLAIRQPAAVAGLSDKIEYATELAKSELLPRQYRDKPANILLMMEYGEYLGIPPVAAIRLIHIIDNKPVASAELIAGRVRVAGHRLRVSYDQAKRTAVCSIWRADDPHFEFRAEWSWERANAVRDKDGAALTAKLNWRNYYPSMLKWRATTECARDACPEILLGVSYTPDELGDGGLTDTEAEEIGLMTTTQRVEHAELRRMNEPEPGAVQKLDRTPDDDPWYTPEAPAARWDLAAPPDSTAPHRTQAGKPALDKLTALFAQFQLDEAEQDTVIAWFAPGEWTASDSQIRQVTKGLQPFLADAGGDVAEARTQLWDRFRKVQEETGRG